MQPLTSKELNYLNDMLSGEDLLIKLCVAAQAGAPQPETLQFLHHVIGEHQRRHDELVHTLEQHESIAH